MGGLVKLFAEKDADLNWPRNSGETPIFIAAENGHAKIVEFLVKKKVDLNRANKIGETPVATAVAEGHTGIVKILIDSGAKVEKYLQSRSTKREIKEMIAKALQK